MLRIYLAGEICLEGTGVLLRERDFPSRQVRHAFAYLVLERQRSVHRDELTEVLWPPPTTSATIEPGASG